MLCLRQKVCRHIPGICRFIRDHQNLAWACNGINAYVAVHGLFGQGHIDIAWSYDLIYLWNALGSIRQRANCLGSAHLIDGSSACLMGGDQGIRGNFPVLIRRRHHHNLFYACHFRRYDVHQHGGWVYCLSARHVYAYPLKRRYLLSQHGPVRLAVKPAVLPLLLMVSLYILEGLSDNLHQCRVSQFIGFLYLIFRYLDIRGADDCLVKLTRIVKDSLVLFSFHARKNLCHPFLVLTIIVGASLQQVFQKILSCIRI